MTTNTIRAIVINPTLKTVVEIAMLNDFVHMKSAHIVCSYAERMDLGEGVDAWFDEEGMLKNWDHQGFTRFTGTLTLAGNIVLTGTVMGDNGLEIGDLPTEITTALILEMVEFIPPQKVKVPGTKLVTEKPDGTLKIESIGPDVLTYNNH